MNQLIIQLILGGIGVAIAILLGMLFLGIDRKIAARFQSRIGPPITQTFTDFVKLLSKQTIVPHNAIGWLFNLMPVIAAASAAMLVLYLPLLDTTPVLENYGDLVVVLYLLAIPAIAMIVGGFASSSPYAAIGAQRKMVTVMSYEVPLATLIIAIVWKTSQLFPTEKAFSFATFANHPILTIVGPVGIIGVVLLFISIMTALCAELIKTPFDAPEADTELAEGILVEYSGRNLALFILSDAAKLVAFVTLVIGLFFPFTLSSFIDLGAFNFAGNAAFFLFKFFIISFIGLSFVRVAFARFKINQVTRFFWIYSAGISLLGLILIVVDSII